MILQEQSLKSKIKFIGIKPGEKLHEELISVHESKNTIAYKNYYVITSNSELFYWNKEKYLKNLVEKSALMALVMIAVIMRKIKHKDVKRIIEKG